MQHDVDCKYNWSFEYDLLISLEKSSVLHPNANNPCRRNTCGNLALPGMTACNVLSVLCTVDDRPIVTMWFVLYRRPGASWHFIKSY